jgi:aconitate hydratase
MGPNSFGAQSWLTVDDRSYEIHRLDRIAGSERLPYSLKVLLENLLRNEDGRRVSVEQAAAVAQWDPSAEHGRDVAFTPGRVLMQDFTGVPCVVDLVGATRHCAIQLQAAAAGGRGPGIVCLLIAGWVQKRPYWPHFAPNR